MVTVIVSSCCHDRRVWPNLGLHYATLAKLEALVGALPRAISAAQSALEILTVTTGHMPEGAALVHDMGRLKYDSEQELEGARQEY